MSIIFRVTIFAVLILGGCTRLSPGTASDLQTRATPVVVVRGYLDWYSTGMDRLTMQLREAGTAAVAFREEQWGSVADALQQSPGPVVLIGFSYGADDVILIARRLNDRHVPVDLLVTIDPVTPSAVPGNVQMCVNFYEPNPFWDIFPWLRGVPLSGEKGGVMPTNIDIRARQDLNEPGTSHGTIAANEKVHRAILELVKNSLPTAKSGAGRS